MSDLGYHHFRRRKLDFLVRELHERGLPVQTSAGTDGVALEAERMLKGRGSRAAALAAALYLSSGVRAAIPGSFFPEEAPDLLLLRVPRRVYTEMQLVYALDALAELSHWKGLRPFQVQGERFQPRCELVVRGEVPLGAGGRPRPEPFVHRVVETMALNDRDRRARVLEEAGYNTFLIPSREVYIDLLTDSGTNAMSSEQWAGMVASREAEGRTEAWEDLERAIQDVLGFRFMLPAHQGRAVEHILSRTLIRPGQMVINNLYFTTTREHQERAGGIFVDLIRSEATDPNSQCPFKGDLDPDRLERLITEQGPERIAYICLETNVNMAGGQPISLAASRRVSEIARYYRIPLYFDATRVAENAYFIKTREPGCQDLSIREIIRQLMSLGDGCTISAKKDMLVNIGGVLATNDADVFERARRLASVYISHGGVGARDLKAMALGAYEMTDFDYLRNRVEQVQYLGRLLSERGIPIVHPVGGHAVFLNAREFLSHLPQEEFPAQRLAAELYLESGVRSMERGLVSAGRDQATGHNHDSPLELVRLTIPRRVYTYSHMDLVADGVERVWQRRALIGGLEMTYEPASLRFFQARFRPLQIPVKLPRR
ncbi:MAG: tryptophanase [Candidatus Xenobia bacterium]